MLSCSKLSKLMLSLFAGILFFGSQASMAQSGLTLYTPYTSISVPPGQSIDYTVDVINNGKELRSASIALAGLPKGWNFDLKSGGWKLSQISVLPGDKKTMNLRVDVPLKVNKGSYHFKLVANGSTTLPLTVVVSSQGTYQSELTCGQINMQGNANATFTFNATLKNQTAEKQLYGLTATTAPGWEVTFKANYKQVTAVEIEPNNNTSLTIEVNPPDNTPAGSYVIPIKAATNSTSASLDLQVAITGTYSMEITTPSGLLSANLTAGESKKIELAVKNTGSSIISNVDLKANVPASWEATMEPQKINEILPGNVAQAFVTIKADKKAIPGDYVTNVEAKTTELNASNSFRITVKTSLIWGWLGIVIILAAFGSVYYLFRRYGRR